MDDKKPFRDNRKPIKRHVDPYNLRDSASPDSDEGFGGVIEGKNAVIEALRAEMPVDKVFIARGEKDSALSHIASKARERGVVVVEADRRKLDSMSVTHSHQGVVAVAAIRPYAEIEDIFDAAREKGEEPFIIVCDEVSDPHNLGAIIRTAEAAGAHGVIIPKRRSAGLTAVVAKTSAGAALHLPIVRIPNISACLNELKKRGVWVFGTSATGASELWDVDLRGSAAIVVGSEGEGLGRLVGESCDVVVKIPMSGKVASLNASVSAAIVIYEAVRQRGAGKDRATGKNSGSGKK